jgi:hypothetical protein
LTELECAVIALLNVIVGVEKKSDTARGRGC